MLNEKGVEQHGEPVCKVAVDPESLDDQGRHSLSDSEFPMRIFRTSLNGCAAIALNPVSTIFSLVILVGLIIYCGFAGLEGSNNIINLVFYGTETTTAFAAQFSWFYMGSIAAWLLFMLYLCVFHGSIKLGNVEPEYSNPVYFALIFTANAAMGLFFYGVGEGCGNQLGGYSGNRFAKNPFLTEDQKSQYAMDLSMFDWGFNTFGPYALVGVLSAYSTHVKGLPMSSRSLFHNFLGSYTWGYLGDIIEGYSIISVMMGLLASLGISVQSLMSGFDSLGWMDSSQMTEQEYKNVQMGLVAAIIAAATVSVATGLNYGIKHLATFAMLGSISLFVVVFMLENSSYVLNMVVQEFGQYVTNIFGFSFYTDAFALLKIGEGRAIDQEATAEDFWVTYFPIYYFAWSVAWSPFVGLFYAKISLGRTVRECLGYTLLVSVLYYLLWFSLFSGGGIKMQRRAWELQNLGEMVHNDTNYYQNAAKAHCFDPPIEPVPFVDQHGVDQVYVNLDPNVGPVCLMEISSPISNTWFDYLLQFKDLGYGLSVLSIICMLFFFVTTSDSTSLIFDYLSTNGDESHTRIQRCFWSIMQGILTIVLIAVGSESSALKTAQGLTILASFPNMIMLSIACMDMLYSFNRTGEEKFFRMPFLGGVFDNFEYLCSLGHHVPGRGPQGRPTSATWRVFALSLFAPFYQVYVIHEHSSKLTRCLLSTAVFVAWVCAIVLLFFQPALAFLGYFWFTMIVTSIRNQCREEFKLAGNAAEDIFTSAIFYPQVLSQVYFERNEHIAIAHNP